MKTTILIIAMVIVAVTVNAQTKKSISDIQKNPQFVVEEIFNVARSKDFKRLFYLCAPSGKADGDIRTLCTIEILPMDQKMSYVKTFEFGQVIGKAIVSGNKAIVQIKFGEQGANNESIHLEKIREKWYLVSM